MKVKLKSLDSKRNSSKTFYKSEDLKNLSDEEFFGDFWEDIFSMKITTRNDEEKRLKIQENLNSHHKVNGFKAENSVSKRLEESGIKSYMRQVMFFNATPKVNLVG